MRVLINGGGIAGNALAFWLSKLGHDVTVVERFPGLRATGLQVDLRGYGIEVMKRYVVDFITQKSRCIRYGSALGRSWLIRRHSMGIEQAFRSKLAPEQGIQIVDKSGKRQAFFPVNRSGKGMQNFTTEFEIMRGDLCRLLYDTAKSRVKYVFSRSVENFEEKRNLLEVRFTDGTTDQFDLLVGADGQYSQIRRLMLGADTPDALHPLNGLYVAYFTMPRAIQESEDYIATSYIAPGRRGIMTRRHNPHEIQVYLGCTTDSEKLKNARRGDITKEKETLAEIFEGAGWQTEEIVNSMMKADDFYCERLGLVKLKFWTKGHVALVGDAAYCPTANTGMGTTSGIVGAYILAGEIGRHCANPNGEDGDIKADTIDGLAKAFKAYEEKFRPFMDQVQKGVSENTSYPSSAFSIAVMNRLLGIASFLKINVGKWMLKEDVKGWNLPDYRELL
jgi:2-polyprenyl-6-methoxyphenol hydroxylase-like FAD-dependent oxidoreductase